MDPPCSSLGTKLIWSERLLSKKSRGYIRTALSSPSQSVRAHSRAIYSQKGGGALKINFLKFLVVYRIGTAFHVQLHPKGKNFFYGYLRASTPREISLATTRIPPPPPASILLLACCDHFFLAKG